MYSCNEWDLLIWIISKIIFSFSLSPFFSLPFLFLFFIFFLPLSAPHDLELYSSATFAFIHSWQTWDLSWYQSNTTLHPQFFHCFVHLFYYLLSILFSFSFPRKSKHKSVGHSFFCRISIPFPDFQLMAFHCKFLFGFFGSICFGEGICVSWSPFLISRLWLQFWFSNLAYCKGFSISSSFFFPFTNRSYHLFLWFFANLSRDSWNHHHQSIPLRVRNKIPKHLSPPSHQWSLATVLHHDNDFQPPLCLDAYDAGCSL